MSDSFDPYRVWLGIPPESRPPTHYEMLGISPKEQERAVIEAAVLRQSGYVRNFQIGQYGKDAARLLNEIAAAKACLLDPAKRAKYDAEFKARRPVAATVVSPTPASPMGLAIDLDQLAGPLSTPPNAANAGSRQGSPQCLPMLLGRHKSAPFPWQVPLGIAATLAIAATALIMLRPRAVEPPTEEVSQGIRIAAGAIDGDGTPATAGTSEPVFLSGNVVRADSAPTDVAERNLAPANELAPVAPAKTSTDVSMESSDNVAASGARDRATGDFAAFGGQWHICYPSPIERMLRIDADGYADYSGPGFPAWWGRLRHDGEATLLAFGDASVARLRIERAMLVVEENAACDFPGKVTGAGIGVRAEGTGASHAIEQKASSLREVGDAWTDFDLHGQLPPPNDNLQAFDARLFRALGEIGTACHAHQPRLPALSSLVVQKNPDDTLGTPGAGYYPATNPEARSDLAKIEAWLEEFRQAKRSTYPATL